MTSQSVLSVLEGYGIAPSDVLALAALAVALYAAIVAHLALRRMKRRDARDEEAQSQFRADLRNVRDRLQAPAASGSSNMPSDQNDDL